MSFYSSNAVSTNFRPGVMAYWHVRVRSSRLPGSGMRPSMVPLSYCNSLSDGVNVRCSGTM